MRNRLNLFYSVSAAIVSAMALPAYAEKEPNLLDLDLETLMTIQVGPSADASAKGLSVPFSGGQVAKGGRIGILSTQDTMDAPFSITNYTQEFIQNQQAASVGDVLQYDPSLRVARGYFNFQQVYMLRGFPIFSDDMTYNGLYGILPRQYLAAELIERVNVLRGANAFLNGAVPDVSGGLGGAVDIIPKRAPKGDLAQITLGAQTYNQHYLAADLAQRSTDGTFGLRFNGVDSGGDMPMGSSTPDASHHLGMAILGADYRGTQLRVSADFGYQNNRMTATQPSIIIADFLAIPKTPDSDQNLAQDWTYSNERDLFGTLRAEYDINKQATTWIAAGTRTGKEASAVGAFFTVNNSAGDYSASRFDVVHQDDVNTAEIGLRIKFQTDAIQHTFTLSANRFKDDSRNAYVIYNPFDGNIYHPTQAAETDISFVGGDWHHPLITSNTHTSSLAVADELALLHNKLLITLGARNQNLCEYNYDYNSGAEVSDYDKSKITPVAGAVYKFSPQYSVYANYIEGLLKGDTAPTTNSQGAVANAGQMLSPYQTRQVEIGLKYDAKSLGGSLAFFNIRKPLAGYNGNNALALVDHEEHQGAELYAYGKLTPKLKLLGGLTYLITDINNKDAIGTPKTQSNLELEWDAAQYPGLSLNAHWMYTGTQFANASNTQKLAAWHRLDLGARYVTDAWGSHALTLRATLENATNENYWASVGGFPGSSYLTIGNPRTFLINASVNF